MRRPLPVASMFLGLSVLGWGATLQFLDMDDMTQKSTSIVRGTVQHSFSAFQGTVIYTHYQVQVLERWKGSAAALLDVAVPGGATKGIRQTYAGAPTPENGKEYVLFLWTGKSGLTQVIGLSQGLFRVAQDVNGQSTVAQAGTTELMLAPGDSRSAVTNAPMRMSLAQLRSVLAAKMAAGAKE
jgi:hypothetical protein